MIDTTSTPAVASASRAGRRFPRRRWVLPTAMVLVIALAPTTGGRGASPVTSTSPTASANGGMGWTALTAPARPVPPTDTSDADTSPKPAGPEGKPAGPEGKPAGPEGKPAGPEELPALPGPVPAKGRGQFAYAPDVGTVLGTAGPVKQFRVAVERDIGEDVAEFAEHVESTLGHPQSWVGGGQIRLRRVSGAGTDRAGFTVFLASRETAAKMCRRSGTDIRKNDIPYTSCRTPGKVIINLDRWRLSAPPYVDAGIPLAVYRQYVINHEVGHELGHAHQGCPKHGGPAPVMVQQTLTLRGCAPYAWPRLGDRWLSGPPARR